MAALPPLVGADAEQAFLKTSREAYEQALAAAAAGEPDVRVDWEIRSGDVVGTLADLADVDVLFCGSRGYGPTRRVLLGGGVGKVAAPGPAAGRGGPAQRMRPYRDGRFGNRTTTGRQPIRTRAPHPASGVVPTVGS